MSTSIPVGDRWVEVEWNSGGRSVVNVRYLLKSLKTGQELKIGLAVVIGKKPDGNPLTATVLASSRERHQLTESSYKEEEPVAGPSQLKEDDGDFSPSASDWEPSDINTSTEESEEEDDGNKLDRSKTRQYLNKSGRKILVPTHRPNAIIPKSMQKLAFENNRKSYNIKRNGSITKMEVENQQKQNAGKPGGTCDFVGAMGMIFLQLFQSYGIVSPSFDINDVPMAMDFEETDRSFNTTGRMVGNETIKNNGAEQRSDSDYSDRSNDNVLITNRYNTVNRAPVNAAPVNPAPVNPVPVNTALKGEWIPIGTGTTLIHKDKFKKVKWKSYTIATRTLLSAAFPRRVLATHSMTGKKSPAFSHKPAKMCLDPKIVSDIVIEVMGKFKVKESFVRSVITTKCADECKMLKMDALKKAKNAKNRENVPPPAPLKGNSK